MWNYTYNGENTNENKCHCTSIDLKHTHIYIYKCKNNLPVEMGLIDCEQDEWRIVFTSWGWNHIQNIRVIKAGDQNILSLVLITPIGRRFLDRVQYRELYDRKMLKQLKDRVQWVVKVTRYRIGRIIRHTYSSVLDLMNDLIKSASEIIVPFRRALIQCWMLESKRYRICSARWVRSSNHNAEGEVIWLPTAPDA